MSNRVYTYSAKDYRIIVGGISIAGLYSGSFLEVSLDEALYQKVLGCDGRNARARNISKSGTVSIALARTSPSNDFLSTLLIADEAGNAGVIPIFIRDANGLTTVFSLSSWVREVPVLTDSTDIERRLWVFDCTRLDMFIGGNSWRTGSAATFRGTDNSFQPGPAETEPLPEPLF